MNAKRHAASLLLGVLLAACAGTSTPSGSSPAAPNPGPTAAALSTVMPSATVAAATPTPRPTARPVPSITPTPTPTPTPPPTPASTLPPPTGRLLVGRFVSETSRGYAFSVVDLATGADDDLGTGQTASWSGDGTRVHVVVEDDQCVPRLVTKTRDGAPVSAVMAGLRSEDYGFAWSPDDRSVAFVRYHNGPPPRMCGSQGGIYPLDQLVSDLVVMRADGTGQRVLVEESGQIRTPLAWSPDGRRTAPSHWRDRPAEE